jgi:hypothetical protein
MKKITIALLALLPTIMLAVDPPTANTTQEGLSGLLVKLNELASNFYILIISLIVIAFA